MFCDLGFEIAEGATLAFQLAVATTAGDRPEEELRMTLDGQPLPVEEIEVDHGGRVHLVRCGPGYLSVTYRGVVVPAPPRHSRITPAEALVALRQSRYCQSDALAGFAATELDWLPEGPGRAHAIADWVHRRLEYLPGSSGPLDTAVDTLLMGQGVCRDFAHLTIALCRALGVPARLVAVYAPGLFPMDFHAVAEVADDDRWQVIDATRLAPRQSLVRIATGRDAADTAFGTTISGSAELITSTVVAFTEGDLPVDDHQRVVTLA